MEKRFSNHNVLFALMIMSVLILTAMITITQVSNYDLWWHLKTGELITEQHTIPTTDPFSFTRDGERWVTHEWLSEIVLFVVSYAAGDSGLIIAKSILIALILFILYLTARVYCSGRFMILLIIPLFLLLSRHRFFVRPHLFSLIFFACEGLLLQAVFKEKISAKRLWWLPVLFVVWVNTHGGFLYGLVLLGIYIAYWIIQKYRRPHSLIPSVGTLVGIMAACVGVCLLNPNGFDVFTYGLTIYKEGYVASNTEWFSPFDPSMREHTMFYVYTVYSVCFLIVSLLAYKRLNVPAVAATLIFFVASAKSQRNIPYFAMTSIPLLVISIDYIKTQRLGHLLAHKRVAEIIKIVCIMAVLTSGCKIFDKGYPIAVKGQGYAKPGIGINESVVPVEAVSFAQKHGINGNLFNSYQFGGYLLYRGYPDIKVFIDGRADVYGKQLYEAYRNSLSVPSYFSQFEEKYSFDAAILESDENDKPLHQYLWNDPKWHLVYFDDTALIYVKKTPRFEDLIEHNRYTAVHPLIGDVMSKHLDINPQLVVAELQRAISDNPRSVSSYVMLARIYRNRRLFNDAERLLNQGLEECPDNYAIINQMGLVYLRQGNFILARKWFTRAIRLNKYFPEAYGNLAITCIEQDDLKQAKKMFRKVLKLNPTDEFAGAALKRLEEQPGW